LKVRQREKLRRALVSAAEFLEWDTLDASPIETALKETLTLAKAGARSLAKDLDEELAVKKAEITTLKKHAATLHKMAGKEAFEEPMEYSYTFTARQGDTLVKKTADLELTSKQDATDAVETIEGRLESWDKLKGLAVDQLKQRQARLGEMTEALPDFTKTHKTLVREVFALLH